MSATLRSPAIVMACGLLVCQQQGCATAPRPTAQQGTQNEPVVTSVTTPTADGRLLEVERITPAVAPRGVIIFSHGANSAPRHYRHLTIAWARAGYVVLSPVHLDSEEHPQRDAGNRSRVLETRLSDWTTVADDALRLGGPDAIPVSRALYAAGHSYGAYIAQIAGGASVIDPASGGTLTLPVTCKLRGIIALSPPPMFEGFSPAGSWHTVHTPMLVQTGSLDIMPPFAVRWQQHLDSHIDAPAGISWSATYRGVDHYFGGMIGRVQYPADAKGERQLQRFVTLSLTFMDHAVTGQLQSLSAEIDQLSDRIS